MKKTLFTLSLICSFAAFVLFQRSSNATPETASPPEPIVAANPPQASKNPAVTSFPPETAPASPPPQPIPAPPAQKPTPAPTPVVVPPKPRGMYNDGTYMGGVADAYYGNIQVQAVIHGGKLTDVVFLDYPQDRGTSIRINTMAMPYLKSEAIQAQSANVDIVSGATASSGAFQQSLASALSQAKIQI